MRRALLAIAAIVGLAACATPSRASSLMVRLDMVERGLDSLEVELPGTTGIARTKHSIANTRAALARAQQAAILWKCGDGRQVNDRVDNLTESLVDLRATLGETVHEPIGLFDALPPKPIVAGLPQK